MILTLDVENNLSVNENQRIALVADSKGEHEEALIIFEKYKILPTVGIYGKNAAGKTNIIKAFKHVKDMIITSHNFNPTKPIPYYTPFKFSTEKDKPSKFEIMFVCNNKRYVYGFSHNSKKVLEEYLYIFNSSKASKIFERDEFNNYTFGNKFESMEYLKERTHDNKLFLSVASQWAANISEINDIFNYFENDILYYQKNCNDNSPGWFEDTTNLLVENEEARLFLKKLITYFDLEMTDITADKTTLEIESMPDNLKNFILNFPGSIIEEVKGESSSISSIYTIDQEKFILNLNEESNGIQKIYELFPFLFKSLTSKKILILDEIEMGLHPLLAKELIKLFQNKEINIYESQLLFTTHDTNILDLSLLRRDQIWFVAKSIEDRFATELYSLSDIKGVRTTDNIARDYLVGKYTNIPKIKSWRDNN